MRGLIIASATLLALGCGNDDETPPDVSVMRGTLEMEIRDEATVRVEGKGDAARATVVLTNGYGLAPSDTPLVGAGRIESFPEAEASLITARFAAMGDATGPCGAAPVSLALSLHRDADNAYVAGGITAYCGTDVWFGKPVRIVRLSGALPP
jgi:hypothetical protein